MRPKFLHKLEKLYKKKKKKNQTNNKINLITGIGSKCHTQGDLFAEVKLIFKIPIGKQL